MNLANLLLTLAALVGVTAVVTAIAATSPDFRTTGERIGGFVAVIAVAVLAVGLLA